MHETPVNNDSLNLSEAIDYCYVLSLFWQTIKIIVFFFAVVKPSQLLVVSSIKFRDRANRAQLHPEAYRAFLAKLAKMITLDRETQYQLLSTDKPILAVSLEIHLPVEEDKVADEKTVKIMGFQLDASRRQMGLGA